MLQNIMQSVFSLIGDISPADMAEQIVKLYGQEMKRNGGKPFAVAVMVQGEKGPGSFPYVFKYAGAERPYKMGTLGELVPTALKLFAGPFLAQPMPKDANGIICIYPREIETENGDFSGQSIKLFVGLQFEGHPPAERPFSGQLIADLLAVMKDPAKISEIMNTAPTA